MWQSRGSVVSHVDLASSVLGPHGRLVRREDLIFAPGISVGLCAGTSEPLFFPGSPKSGNGRTEVTVHEATGIRYLSRSSHPLRVRASASPSRATLLSAQYKAVGGHAEKRCTPPCLGTTTSGKQRRSVGVIPPRNADWAPDRDALSRAITDGAGATLPRRPCEEIHPDLTAPTASWRKARGGPSRGCNLARPPTTHPSHAAPVRHRDPSPEWEAQRGPVLAAEAIKPPCDRRRADQGPMAAKVYSQ